MVDAAHVVVTLSPAMPTMCDAYTQTLGTDASTQTADGTGTDVSTVVSTDVSRTDIAETHVSETCSSDDQIESVESVGWVPRSSPRILIRQRKRRHRTKLPASINEPPVSNKRAFSWWNKQIK
jgi:hypothetical protein